MKILNLFKRKKPSDAKLERKALIKRRIRKMSGNRSAKAVSAYEQCHMEMMQDLAREQG